VLTSGVQFFRPERPGVTLGSFVLGEVLRWYCGPLLNVCWQLTCVIVLILVFECCGCSHRFGLLYLTVRSSWIGEHGVFFCLG
jgi:hypothetical protein